MVYTRPAFYWNHMQRSDNSNTAVLTIYSRLTRQHFNIIVACQIIALGPFLRGNRKRIITVVVRKQIQQIAPFQQ